MKNRLILLAALLLLAAPFLIYQIKFNGPLSDSHEVWAQFGDYISGIYAPILSVLTIGVLAIQVQIQKRMADTAEVQKYLDDNAADLEYQVLHMQEILNRADEDDGRTIRSVLDDCYYNETDEDVLKFRSDHPVFRNQSADIVSAWGVIYTTLYAFRNRDHPMYELAFRRAIVRLQVTLTHRTCSALDEFHRENSLSKMSRPYVFVNM